jgi:hypothetical protein
MEGTLIDTALAQSIWAALSIALIFYILKKQDLRDKAQAEREERYQEIICNLTEKLNLLEHLKESVDELKYLWTK